MHLPSKSHTVNSMFLYCRVSTFNPTVGTVNVVSPSSPFNLYKIVVLPASSNPTTHGKKHNKLKVHPWLIAIDIKQIIVRKQLTHPSKFATVSSQIGERKDLMKLCPYL